MQNFSYTKKNFSIRKHGLGFRDKIYFANFWYKLTDNKQNQYSRLQNSKSKSFLFFILGIKDQTENLYYVVIHYCYVI